MVLRVLCVLVTIVIVKYLQPCDAQAQDEDSHMCVKPFLVPKQRIVSWKCKNNQICTKNKKVYVRQMSTSCCEGWIFSTADNKCIPDCKRGCTRGTCVAPDTCMCDPPLILKHNNMCEEPQCNPSCVNANCVEDDKCICNEGFIQHNTTHCAPICPDGFVNDPLSLECKPVCDKCDNGRCTAPNTCTCDKGYALENFTCVPHCNPTCKSGKCVAPDTCECSVGYIIDPLDKSLCHPRCEKQCINATCVEPNKCACLMGFEHVSAWACKPKCDQCNNGQCIGPNQCKCLDGYSKTDGINCLPVCSQLCSDGYCSAPDTCSCKKGYKLDTEDKFKCRPICSDTCVNATCVSPDTCACLPGFEKLNRSVCRPSCASCEHGVCISPDNCQCNDGFNKTNGVCNPICSTPCVNGFCEKPESCVCNDGYIKAINQSVCYKPCAGECDNGQCDIHGNCSCGSEYKLFNNTCIILDYCDKCNGTCSDDICLCEDRRPCRESIDSPAEAFTSLAGLQITWVLGGSIGILILTIVIITIGYLWKKRKEYGDKPTENGNGYPSVLYTIPNTLIQNNYSDNRDDTINEDEDEDAKEAVSVNLLEHGKEANYTTTS